jgi:23S rRNA (cytosine1962-C5)-methyltransferase
LSTTVIQTATPKNWKAYQLLDSGGFEKLEKFGDYILRRPEPQAAWDKSLSELEWQNSECLFQKRQRFARKRRMDVEKRNGRALVYALSNTDIEP